MQAILSRPRAIPRAIRPVWPLLELLDPREQTRPLLIMLAIGMAIGALGMLWWGLPLWGATVIVLLLLLGPAILKWRGDLRRYGRTAMVMSILVTLQGFHSVEHATQAIEYHLLNWSAQFASGLVSAANVEWIHFIWNWAILLVIVFLVLSGMRNPWAYLLMAWSFSHCVEHTYLFIRYLDTLNELGRLGVTNVPAQGLPGILGRDGWLASSAATQGTFLCRLPVLTTAVRLDIHFWWNASETIMIIMATSTYCARTLGLGRR